MKWLLLFIIFSGPTSADRIEFGGWFADEKECITSANKNRWAEHVCIPFGDRAAAPPRFNPE